MFAKFQRGAEMEQALTQFAVKVLCDVSTSFDG